MTVSVIIPSKFDLAPSGEPWVCRALGSVAAQTWRDRIDKLYVAVDHGMAKSAAADAVRHSSNPTDIRLNWEFVEGPRGMNSHVSAMNAALARRKVDVDDIACGNMVAFLEDDDLWHRQRLEVGLTLFDRERDVDLVTSSQQEINEAGVPVRINDFPTCSGWLGKAFVFYFRGGFDQRFKIHWDNEFLGRIAMQNDGQDPVRRIHLLERDPDINRPWIANVAQFSKIMRADVDECLVKRVVHADSIMGNVANQQQRQERSRKEYEACQTLFNNCIPW